MDTISDSFHDKCMLTPRNRTGMIIAPVNITEELDGTSKTIDNRLFLRLLKRLPLVPASCNTTKPKSLDGISMEREHCD